MDNYFENKIISEKLLKERIIFLDKEINSATASEVVSKLLYLDSESNDDIMLYINSPGGEVSSGFMIYDTINIIKSDVQTISVGTAASMAAIILLVGTKGKRKILPNSKVMLHDLSGEAKGKFKDVITEVKEMNKLHNKIFEIIENNTNFTKEQIEENLKNDFWLNSEEALRFGLVDKIITNNKTI